MTEVVKGAEADKQVKANTLLMENIKHLESLILKLGEFKNDLALLSPTNKTQGGGKSSCLSSMSSTGSEKSEKKVHFKITVEETKSLQVKDGDYWTPDSLIPKPIIHSEYDEPIMTKANYTNMEIIMGQNPGYESEVAIASSGY
jgi:hypothetical protein